MRCPKGNDSCGAGDVIDRGEAELWNPALESRIRDGACDALGASSVQDDLAPRGGDLCVRLSV